MERAGRHLHKTIQVQYGCSSWKIKPVEYEKQIPKESIHTITMVEWIKQDVKAKKIMDSSEKKIFYKSKKDI
jgi:hypothetical protein